jgi:hypothetical protein
MKLAEELPDVFCYLMDIYCFLPKWDVMLKKREHYPIR